jgi:hypothetical protein
VDLKNKNKPLNNARGIPCGARSLAGFWGGLIPPSLKRPFATHSRNEPEPEIAIPSRGFGTK